MKFSHLAALCGLVLLAGCNNDSATVDTDQSNIDVETPAELTLDMSSDDNFQASFDSIMQSLDETQRQQFALALRDATNEAIEVTDVKLRQQDPDRYALCDADEVETTLQMECSVWFMGEMDDWLNDTLDGTSASALMARYPQD